MKTKIKLQNSTSRIKSIAAGTHHSLALDYSGNIYAWGRNQKGQLGNL